MIEEGHSFQALQVDPRRMHVLGTPAQLQAFCIGQRAQPRLRICFDLDHTLVTAPRVPGDYSTCEPIYDNITACRALKTQGHHIIVATGRRMRTHKGNTAAVIADVGAVTLNQLRDLGIPHDEVVFGKPYAQFYIDDLAVSAFDDIHKAIGFYRGAPACDDGSSKAAAATPAPPRPQAPPARAAPVRAWLPLGVAFGVGCALGLLVGARMSESLRDIFRGVTASAASTPAVKATL
jgi:capsule biosynthesis phosphatase